MKIGRLEIFGYKQTSETGYIIGLRSYRYGINSTYVKEKYGSGFTISVILFDYHICLDVMLSLPAARESRKAGRVAKI